MSNVPSGITLRTVTYTGVNDAGVGMDQIVEILAVPLSTPIWKATRWKMPVDGWLVRARDSASLPLPVTDQSGYQEVSGKDSGNPSVQYWIRVRVHAGTVLVKEVSKIIPLPAGDLSPVDLDTMLPVGTVAGGAVLVPASWSARLDALEAGGGGGGGGGGTVRRVTLNGSHVVDTSTWITDQAQTVVFTQGGTGGHPAYHDDTPVDVAATGATVTAWVWTGAEWRWFSDAAPTEVVVVDETPPTAGNLQLSAAPTDIVATSVAAMDETALHPQPYRFAIATTAASSGWSDAQWEAAMGAWQASATATLAGLTMGTAYSARCQVRDMAGNMRMTAVVNATTTVVSEPSTIYEATFTAPDGTLLSAYTPEVGGPGTLDGGRPGQIFGGGLWTIPNPEWHSSPNIFLTSAASQKLVRFTFDYDYTAADNYGVVWFEVNTYRGFGLGKLQGLLSGGNHQGTMVSSEVSPTAPTIPVAGRAMFEFEGTPGVMSNWTNRAYFFVDDEPVLHTTEVITGNSAANTFKITVGASMNSGTPGVNGTKLNSAKLEGVPQ